MRSGIECQTGSLCDGGFSVEGVSATAPGQTVRIAYEIVDDGGEDEEVVATVDRTVAVRPADSVSFSAGELTGGQAVVVRRSTDPVRINNATCLVSATGLADGRYRLHTDRGRFAATDSQTTEVSLVNGQASAALYGYDYSVTTNDAAIYLRSVEGQTFASTNYTVLWVEISMRCGQGDPFSEDNGMLAHSSNPIYDKLGMQKHAGFILPSENHNSPAVFGNIVEFSGTVHPIDFTNRVVLVRDCIDELAITIFTNGAYQVIKYATNKVRGAEPSGNDPTESDFLDVDPRPNGRVFDVDTPGLSVIEPDIFPHGTFQFARYNFIQYAAFGNKRCSNDFLWHSRTTIRRNFQDDPAEFSFYSRQDLSSDNECGTGHTGIQP